MMAMLLVFATIFATAEEKECYSQASYASMTLQSGQIYILLTRNEDADCDFPRGVLVTLNFVNPLLDTYQIFNDFDFKARVYLLINLPCTNCADYEDVRNVEVTISSPQLKTTFMAGAMENIREYTDRCDSFGMVQVEEDFSGLSPPTIKYQLPNTCADISGLVALESATLAIETMAGETIRFSGATIVGGGTFAFSDIFDVQKFYDSIAAADFNLRFRKDGILKTFHSATTTLLLGAGASMGDIDLTILKENIEFTATRGAGFDALNNYLDAHLAATAHLSMNFQYKTKKYQIRSVLEAIIFENNGLLQCSRADKPDECYQILRAFSEIDNQQISVWLLFQFYDKDAKPVYAFTASVRKIKNVCYEDATADVVRGKASFTLNAMKGSVCSLTEKQKTEILFGYYLTYLHKVENNPDRIQIIQRFEIDNFDYSQRQIDVLLDAKQFAAFYTRQDKKEAFSYQLAFYRGGALVQNVDITDLILTDSQSFLRYCLIFAAICEIVVIVVVAASWGLQRCWERHPIKKVKAINLVDDM